MNEFSSGPFTTGSPQISRMSQIPILSTGTVETNIQMQTMKPLEFGQLQSGGKIISTKDKLKNFWDNAKKNPGYSQKCYLDARYFNHILTKNIYPGVIPKPMYIAIAEGDFTSDPDDGDKREFRAGLGFDEQSLKDSSGTIRFIRVIIEIGKEGKQGVSRHSNLIWINTKTKNIYRFEPIADHPYFDVISGILSDYFEEKLPEYDFNIWGEFPQAMTSFSCPGRGYCSAFVLMKAMMIITGKDMMFPEDPNEAEKLAMKFSYAIEQQYGTLSGPPVLIYGYWDGFTQNWFTPSKWTSAQKTVATGLGAAALGGLLTRSWTGALLTGAAGAGAAYLLTKNQ